MYLVLILGSVLMIFPFIWMISTSFKTVPETTLIPPTLLPASFSNTAAYEQVTKSLPFFNLYFNTIMMIVIRVICAVVFSSMAAYAFAKVNFPLKNLFFMIVLSQLMFPAQVFILPQYEMISALGKTDSLFALVFPALVSAFGTFFLRQTYMGIPDDLLEAARIDGCGYVQTWVKVIFPIARPGIMTAAVLAFLNNWNEYYWASLVLITREKLTVPALLSTFTTAFNTNYNGLFSAMVVIILPPVILYCVFSKFFIEALSGGAVKG